MIKIRKPNGELYDFGENAMNLDDFVNLKFLLPLKRLASSAVRTERPIGLIG